MIGASPRSSRHPPAISCQSQLDNTSIMQSGICRRMDRDCASRRWPILRGLFMKLHVAAITFAINLLFAIVVVGLVAIDLVAAEAFATQGEMMTLRMIECGVL
jgi:hypothetical protein